MYIAIGKNIKENCIQFGFVQNVAKHHEVQHGTQTISIVVKRLIFTIFGSRNHKRDAVMRSSQNKER